MKTSLLLLAAFAATAVADDEVIPTALSKDRYEAMVAKSPFVLATPPEVKEEAVSGPFDNTFIKGLGTGYVVVQKLGDEQPMRFWGSEPNQEQVFVKEVKWSDKPGATTVVLKKGSYEKEIGFNENDIHAAPPAQGPAVGQRPPGAGGPNPNFPRPGGPQGMQRGPVQPGGAVSSVPRPSIQPAIPVPRPSAPAVQPQPQAAPGGYQNRAGMSTQSSGRTQPAANNGGNGGDTGRRRIRVIGN